VETFEKFPSNILARVVVRVKFVLALLTHGLVFRSPVRLVCKAALRTPLARVRGTHLLDLNTEHFGFVFDVLVQAAERPRVESLRTSHPIANIRQILERNVGTAVVTSFVENLVRGAMEFVLYPAVFSIVHRLDR